MKLENLKDYWKKSSADWNYIFTSEFKNIFRDQGTVIFFLLVPLVYPLLYSFIYTGEVVREVPVAVVDLDRSTRSRDYLRRMDASADVKVVAFCADMEEARSLIREREVYGIVCVPEDFNRNLSTDRQTHVNVFADMSGLLYYKAILTANTNVSLAMNAEIKARRSGSTTAEQEKVAEHPITYEEVNLFNPTGGFAAFLLPGVLMLIIQQTLLLGVGILAGTAREQNRYRELMPIDRHYNGLLRIVFGRAMAYLMIYLPVTIYVLGVVPRLFSLNQIGAPGDMALFVVPFLLACIFFAMTVSAFIHHRETCILIIVFTSVPLLFISGISWPGASVPEFWKWVGYVFPSTFGINGFVQINNMGARLIDVRPEWHALWLQAFVYFLTTCLVYRAGIIGARKRFIERYKTMKERRERLRELQTADEK